MARTPSPQINGAAVAAIRKAKGIRQTDLARDALVSPQYLADIERGARNASTPVAERLAVQLGVELRALVPTAAA